MSGGGVDEDIEVALEAVLKGSQLEELIHKLVGVNAAAQIEGELEAGQVDLVSEIGYLLEFTLLDKLGYLIEYKLDGGGVGYLYDVYTVFHLVVVIAGAYSDRA